MRYRLKYNAWLRLGMVVCTHICEILDGNPHAPILNVNDDERNLNANHWGNDWDERYRFPVVRNFISYSRAFAREFSFSVCASIWLCQPPSMRPTSKSFSESAMNFFASSASTLFATRRRSFTVSSS